MKTYRVDNVKCGGCANTLKTKLADEFGNIEVNLDLMPREITLDIKEEKETDLRVALKSLGYPMNDENLGFIEDSGAKAKSFVSCAIGKFEVAKQS
ncbi:MAG: heavy-metal-associated domain-containing protein [Campylobacterota bacterium]|nr:heavy-metal-associated domain-containing protein [Campylobacterota bacterium]